MPKNVRFWRNVTLIGLAHAALIFGLVRWSRETKNAGAQNVVWMNGGAGDGVAPEKKNPPPARSVRPPPPRVESKTEPSPIEERDEDRPVLTSARSEIQLPTPKPSPTSTATPKPTPKPTPKVKETPKPTPKPKPKPKPTPKPTPKKTVLAKASPKPSAKPTPEEADENEQQTDADAEKKKIAKEALRKSSDGELPKKATAAAEGAGGKGTSAGANGRVGGAGPESQFGWYGSMLHDRFYSEWVQPTSIPSTGAKNSVLVKIRIEKDGRVSNFEIVRPSGNEALDDSVNAVAKRVTQVDSLPGGLGTGDHYDVKINFELNSDQ
jgi:TonB family protein